MVIVLYNGIMRAREIIKVRCNYGGKLSIKERMSELEDVLAAVECQYEVFIDDMCQIIFEG